MMFVKRTSGTTGPEENNLETAVVADASGRRFRSRIVIPVGIVNAKGERFIVKVGSGSDCPTVHYKQHAVDLAFALTVWKSQGCTLKYVLALLEGSPGVPKWQFEHLYVAHSRVPRALTYRCFTLSECFQRHTIAKLRPNIWAVKWRMAVNKDGYWQPVNDQPVDR
eukprot:GHVU01155170.1.p1 GENE.GHVU01155170.1~~GHVU01155170.1.p1  ORF type:complete len:166 (-),score=4.80 GHVU01155170.1:7-504(-)